jgi:hypothetical protein
MRLAAPTPYRGNAASMNVIAQQSPTIEGSRVSCAKAVVTRRGAHHAGAGALPEGQRCLLPAHRARTWRSRCARPTGALPLERLRSGQTATVCKSSHNDHEYATGRMLI